MSVGVMKDYKLKLRKFYVYYESIKRTTHSRAKKRKKNKKITPHHLGREKEQLQEDGQCSGRSLHLAGLSPALHSLYLRMFVHTVLNNCVSSQSGKHIQRASSAWVYVCGTHNA